MSNLVQTIAEALAKKFAGKEALREIGERLKTLESGLLSPEKLEGLERLLKHVNEIDPPPPVKIKSGLTFFETDSAAKTAAHIKFIPTPPSGQSTKDLSQNGDGSILGWLDGDTYYVAPKTKGQKIEIDSGRMMFRGASCQDVSFENTIFTGTDMSSMFNNCSALQKVSGLIPENVFNAQNMFKNAPKLADIEGWTADTYKLMNNVTSIFDSCSLFDPAVKEFDFSTAYAAGNCSGPFYGCGISGEVSLTGDYGTVNFDCFMGAKNITGFSFKGTADLSGNVNIAFTGCSSLQTIDLSGVDFNNGKITSLTPGFSNCAQLKTIYADGDWTAIPNRTYGTVAGVLSVFLNDTSLPGYSVNKTSGEYCKPTSAGGYFSEKQ